MESSQEFDTRNCVIVVLFIGFIAALVLDFRGAHPKPQVEFSPAPKSVEVSLSDEVDRLYEKFDGSVCVIAIPVDHTLFIGNATISPERDDKVSESRAPIYSDGCRFVIGKEK
jgi:hypothetical protein